MNHSTPISFTDPDVRRCPFDTYTALQKDQPVYVDPVTGNYILTRYDDVRRALMNFKALSNRTGLIHVRHNAAADKIYEEEGWLPLETLVNNDPPEHGLYRTLVDKVFTHARVASLEDHISGIVAELIDDMVMLPEVDFIEKFALQLPMRMIAEQLGVPKSDIDTFKIWTDRTVELISQTITPEREIEIARDIVSMQQYIAKIIEQVRLEPTETLISQLANTETQGRELNIRELQSIIQQILVAGNDTTAASLASAMKILVERPDLVEAINSEPERARPFVEEVLRLKAAIQVLFRKAMEDLEIGGVMIPAGAIVEVRFGAANVDRRQFADPMSIDLDRPNGQSHLAFGFGRHMCIGNQLSRTELKIAVQGLTSRLKNLKLSRGESGVRWIDSYIGHGPSELWISYATR